MFLVSERTLLLSGKNFRERMSEEEGVISIGDDDDDERLSEQDKPDDVDGCERPNTHESNLKLNIFKAKNDSLVRVPSSQNQRSFLPKKSRKLSPRQATGLTS